MDLLENLNATLRYIEDNPCGEIDEEKLTRIACVGSLKRFTLPVGK
ncbi:MAG: hypothetical protein GX929_01900 [Clostridiales bacterium]|jgi:hypothetical protein|nr:hypothetical protein [Clostridiales bacterium]